MNDKIKKFESMTVKQSIEVILRRLKCGIMMDEACAINVAIKCMESVLNSEIDGLVVSSKNKMVGYCPNCGSYNEVKLDSNSSICKKCKHALNWRNICIK